MALPISDPSAGKGSSGSGGSDKGGFKFNINAAAFVPSGPTIVKSAQYRADDPSYFDQIKAQLASFKWNSDVKTVYVTNGWHQNFETVNGQGMFVWLCDYRLNSDSAAINHWYPDLDFPPGTC